MGKTPPDGKEGLRQVLAAAPKKAGFGNNEDKRRAYLLAQQALRRFAERGYTLETDPEGVAQMRLPTRATRALTDFASMASAWPVRRVTGTDALGQAVRGWRERLGVPRSTVCKAADVSERFLQSVEGGKRTMQLGNLLDVLDVLGLELVIRVRREPPEDDASDRDA